MRIFSLLYEPPSIFCSRAADADPRVCVGSVFPQEGCPLARFDRVGQDNTASDFGVCVAGPVRPLVAVPIGPYLQHAHKAPTDGTIRGTVARPKVILPGASAATQHSAGGTLDPFIVGWLVVLYASGGHNLLSLSSMAASRPLGMNQNNNVYVFHHRVVGHRKIQLAIFSI
jgi:hypothetical protein